jgi:outer membrane protein assembly factor BamA
MGAWLAWIAPAPTTAAGGAPADSLRPRTKVPDRSPWEYAAAVPSAAVLLPFEILFVTTRATLDFVEATHAIQRVSDFLVSDTGHRALLPAYSTRGGVGALYVHRGLVNPGSKFEIRAMGGPRARQTYETRLRRLRFANGRVGAAAVARYQRLPSEPFFGLRQDSRAADETSYGFEHTTLRLDVESDLTRTLQATAGVLWTASNVRAGRGGSNPSLTAAPVLPPGTLERPHLVRTLAGLTWDRRDHPGRPTRGSQGLLGGAVARETTGGDFGWTEWQAAFTQYLHLGYGRTLGLSAAATVQEPLRGHRIPFYDVTALGGRESLRGFDRDRFRDQCMLRASAEYRFPVHPDLLDGALFVDAGRVFSDLIRDDPSRTAHVGYGIGLRAWNARSVFGTFDLAYSREGWHLYVALN